MRQIRVFAVGLILTAMYSGCQPTVPASASSGFSMATDSFAFENFAHGYAQSKIDSDAMVRMFGTAVCTGAQTPCTLKPAAKAWMDQANGSMAGGRCEGFAVLSTLLSSGDVKPEAFGGADARSLSLQDSPDLQRELAYWFATQMVPDAVANKTKSYAAKDVMPFLAQILKPDAPERYRLGIVNKKGTKVFGGHAMTPIGYRSGDKAGVYYLRVYDNNNPDSERELKIDVTANRWEYEAARNPTKHSSLFFGDDTNKNPLYFAPVRTRLGTLPCAFCDKTGGLTANTSGGVEAVFNSAGASAGVKDGQLSAQGGAAVSPTFSSDLEDGPAEYTFSLPNPGELSISLGGDPEQSSGGLSTYGPGYVVSLDGLKLSAEQNNSLSIARGGQEVKFENADRTPLTFTTAVEGQGGKTVQISVSLNAASETVAIQVNPDTGGVQVGTEGSAGAAVSVAVTETSAAGESRSGQLEYLSGDGGVGTLRVELNSWVDGGLLNGTIDEGNGEPRPVTDACLDGTRGGQETDVDCGGPVCMKKCSLSQACLVASDCESTFCHGTLHVCVQDACLDATQDGSETDVDCGGASCGRCATGKRCNDSSDCLSGACVNKTCATTFAVGVEVTGLPAGATLTLQNNGRDDLLILANGSFQFPTRIIGQYAVAITQQPGNAACTLSNASGSLSSDVSVTVSCVPLWQIAGTLQGLPQGQAVSITNNGGDATTLTNDGTFFFATLVRGAYSVAIQSQPNGAVCTVSFGSGTASTNITNVAITCVQRYSIGGTLSGLPASRNVVLQNNGGDDLTLSGDGSFVFATPVSGAYHVAVRTQPIGATCAVANGDGTAASNVTDVSVVCTAPGSLDRAFGGGAGYVRYQPNGVNNGWNSVALNPDDTQVWAGFDELASDTWAVSKLTVGGALDPTFGAGGYLRIDRGLAAGEAAQVIRRLPTGDFLVAGRLQVANFDVAVAKVTAAGVLDTTFGNGGVVTHDFGGDETIQDMFVMPDGRMVLCGFTYNGSDTQSLVTRLTSTGAIDTSFAGGSVILGTVGVDDEWRSLVVDGTGAVYVAGWSGNDSALTKLNPGGGYDFSFNGSGQRVIDFSQVSYPDNVRSIILEQSGTLLIGGQTDSLTGVHGFVARLSTTGALLPSWGTSGVVTIGGASPAAVTAIHQVAGGQILAVGYSVNSGLVARFRSDGSVDSTFATGGFFISSFVASFGDVAVDSVGRIVTGGFIGLSVSDFDFGAVRLNP